MKGQPAGVSDAFDPTSERVGRVPIITPLPRDVVNDQDGRGGLSTHARAWRGRASFEFALRRETHASVTMRRLPCGEGFFTCDRNRISKKSNGDEHECGLDSLEAGARALDTGAGPGWMGGGAEHARLCDDAQASLRRGILHL